MVAFKLTEREEASRLAFKPKKVEQPLQEVFSADETLRRAAENVQLSEFANSSVKAGKAVEVASNLNRIMKKRGEDHSLVNSFSQAISSVV